MNNAWIKKAGFCTGILLCGVSSYSLMHQIAEENAGKFNNTYFVIGKDTISMQDFYYNLENSNLGWIYTNNQGALYVWSRQRESNPHFKLGKLAF